MERAATDPISDNALTLSSLPNSSWVWIGSAAAISALEKRLKSAQYRKRVSARRGQSRHPYGRPV